MVKLGKINKALNLYLRPQTFPLAVRMCTSADELPVNVKLPKRDLGIEISLCHGITIARRYGWTVAIGEEGVCPWGSIGMGFLPVKPSVSDGSFQESIGLWSKKVAAARVQYMDKLEFGKYKYALIAPLERATFEPNLIIVYGNPAQIWLLIAGRLEGTGELLSATVGLGAGLGCTVLIARTMNTNECQFSLVAGGERLVCHPQDYECALSIPMSKVEKTIQGLKSGYKRGIFRYPVPSFLRYKSYHPQKYTTVANYLKEVD